jgi:hypothetical protein
VIAADNPALQERPKVFRYCSYERFREHIRPTYDRRSGTVKMLQIAIAAPLIRLNQADFIRNRRFNERTEGVGTRIFDCCLANDIALASMAPMTVILPVLGAPPPLYLARTLLAAEKGLINLDFVRQWKGIPAHRGADSMAHKPCGFVADRSKHPMDLQGAHSFLGMEHQEDDLEPIAQLDVRVLEYRARQDAKPVAILGASQDFARLFVDGLCAALADVVERSRRQLERLANASRALIEARKLY